MIEVGKRHRRCQKSTSVKHDLWKKINGNVDNEKEEKKESKRKRADKREISETFVRT
jgi:hypothetical protein